MAWMRQIGGVGSGSRSAPLTGRQQDDPDATPEGRGEGADALPTEARRRAPDQTNIPRATPAPPCIARGRTGEESERGEYCGLARGRRRGWKCEVKSRLAPPRNVCAYMTCRYRISRSMLTITIRDYSMRGFGLTRRAMAAYRGGKQRRREPGTDGRFRPSNAPR